MTYRLLPSESPTQGLRRVAREQLGKALEELGNTTLDPHETIHQVRKRGKKLRALLRLVRPGMESTYQQENAAIRDAARRLSDLRDRQANLETLDLLEQRYADSLEPDALQPLRQALTQRRDALAQQQLGEERRLEHLRADLLGIGERVHRWEVAHGLGSVTAGLRKTYERARRRHVEVAEGGDIHALHEWRKRCKYHRYHIRLLEDCWPPVLEARRDELHRLTDLQGEAHDLFELQEALTGLELATELRELLRGLAASRRHELRTRALNLGQRLLADEGNALVHRLEASWKAARQPTGR